MEIYLCLLLFAMLMHDLNSWVYFKSIISSSGGIKLAGPISPHLFYNLRENFEFPVNG